MKVKITEGMKFQHISVDKEKAFVVESHDYYGDGEPILCACTDKVMCPLSEICLENYIPMIDGVWINEPNEYEY